MKFNNGILITCKKWERVGKGIKEKGEEEV